jgi:hypothetical protein
VQSVRQKKKFFIIFSILGTGEAVKLNDMKLPAGWEKRAKLKTCGTKAGKWDVVIIGYTL